MSVLCDFGFKIMEDNGEFYLRSVPYIFDKPATTDFLTDIIDTLKSENITNIYDKKTLDIATMALSLIHI